MVGSPDPDLRRKLNPMKKNRQISLIEFKGSTVPVILISLRTLDLEQLQQTARELFGDSDFFDGEAGILDLSLLPEDLSLDTVTHPATAGADASASTPPDWPGIVACLASHGLRALGIRGAPSHLSASAVAAGLVLFPADERRQAPAAEQIVAATLEARPDTQPEAETEATPSLQAADQASPAAVSNTADLATPSSSPSAAAEVAAIATPPAKVSPVRSTLVVDKPLRSGQQVYAQGRDLVVLAIVNPGAEVIADGSIHVYAPLRGRALAGAQGDSQARIFTSRFEAELVSIAGVYRTFENGVPAELASRPVQVRADADGDRLLLDPLKLD